jgi:predicted nucleic acid-binding protein
MKHYFIDTNVLLDFLLRRDGFGPDALRLFAASDVGLVKLYVSGLSFSHIYYTMRKTNLASERLAALQELADLVEIVPIGRHIIEGALALGFADFEDGLQYCAARSLPAIQAIVTRDPKGFAAGALPVLTPPAALARVAG